MFVSVMKSHVKPQDGIPTLSLPFPSPDIAWPLFVPTHDAGVYVLGLFEGGSAANGAHAHAVSFWTTPGEVVGVLSKAAGREVRWKSMAPEEYQSGFENAVLGLELVETMRLVGEYSYYGKGEEGRQGESDRWLLSGAEKMGLERWVKEKGPWAWE